MTIYFLFGVGDFLDALGSCRRAQPSGEHGIVAQSERGKKLLASDRDSLVRHCVSPCNPVELLRINQRPVHVPQYGTSRAHLPTSAFTAMRIRILPGRSNAPDAIAV